MTCPTHGPWSIDSYGVVIGGGEYLTTICETPVVKWRNVSTYGVDRQRASFESLALQAEANGRLIVMAPDMLSICDYILSGDVEIEELRKMAQAIEDKVFEEKDVKS